MSPRALRIGLPAVLFLAAFVALTIWAYRELGEGIVLVLSVALGAVLAAAIIFGVLRPASKRRTDTMRRLGFTPAPDEARGLSGDTELRQLFESTSNWNIEPDRAFRGVHQGIPLLWFDYFLHFGDTVYPGATVIAVRRSDLSGHVTAAFSAPLPPGAQADLKVAVWNDTLYCWRTKHTCAAVEPELLAFLDHAMHALKKTAQDL